MTRTPAPDPKEPTMTTDPQTGRPEVDDPRVLALAKARQQMAHNNPFNVVCPPWDGLTGQEQQLSLLDARNYLRAAIDAGLTVAAPVGVPRTDRAGLRDRIAEALVSWTYRGKEPDSETGILETVRANAYSRADAVLSVLPDTARLHDEILTLRADQAKMRDLLRTENQRADAAIDRETAAEEAEEEHRLALSTALGLGTSAPWDAIRERAAELAGQDGDRGAEVGRLTAERDELRAAWNSLVRSANEDAAALVEVGHLVGASLGTRTVSVRSAAEAIGIVLRRLAAETPGPETQARRGDGFEQWLKAQRDEYEVRSSPQWATLDEVLDTYRLHADTGTPLGEHVCEGRTVGDCDCLETPPPAVVAEPGKDPS